MRTAVILGLTGSIGTTALRGVSNFKDTVKVIGASVHSNVDKAIKLCLEHNIANLCITSKAPVPSVPDSIKIYLNLEEMLCTLNATVVLNGIAGSAGLAASVSAVKSGSELALANKETVVLGGNLFLDYAASKDVKVIPVDSEHSALDELISNCGRENVSKLVITASGGPFRNTELEKLWDISPETAANHPTWKMGPKISIDSSTLANKGLEVIEAHYLFDFAPEKIEVVIHPQSIVHSMVRTTSGQVYAQLSPPDMVFPIMRALTGSHFERPAGKELDFSSLDLNFRKPDYNRFPFVADAFECIRKGGSYPIAYNAADEAAVALFMQGKIKYPQIHTAVNRVLNLDWSNKPKNLEEIPLIEKRAYNAVLSGEPC